MANPRLELETLGNVEGNGVGRLLNMFCHNQLARRVEERRLVYDLVQVVGFGYSRIYSLIAIIDSCGFSQAL